MPTRIVALPVGPEWVAESYALAGNLDIGHATIYGTVYLAQFLLICKLLITALPNAEIERCNQLEEQLAINGLAEEALQQANEEPLDHRDHLERSVVERTRELKVARAEVDSAIAFKTRFMANVSHEMQTPLQGILGYAEVGKVRLSDSSTEELDTYFDRILSSGNQMHRLVEGLLTLTNKSCTAHCPGACDGLSQCHGRPHALATGV